MRVKEISELMEDATKASKMASLFDKLLDTCWIETTNAGVYPEFDGDWSRILIGDRLFTLLEIRKATYGAKYEFDIQCQMTQCRHKIQWEMSLDKLPVQPLSDESKDIFKAGNRFEAAIPSNGKKIWFRLITGADETNAAKPTTVDDDDSGGPLVEALLARVVEIEGVPVGGRRAFIEDLEMGDFNELIDVFDEADCGVETTFDVQCDECGRIQEVELPFDRDFLLPRKR